MSFLDINLNDVKELVTAPDGEYELQIIEAELKTVEKQESKAFGQQMINVRLEILGEENSKDIYHTVWLPKKDDDEKKRNGALRALKAFCDAFGINYATGLNIEDFQGKRGWAILGTETSEQYGDKNIVKRVVTGK